MSYSSRNVHYLCRLESLFYLDTPTKQASSKLVKPKPMEELPRRKEKSALSLYSRDKEAKASDDAKGNGISAKTFSVQNRRERRGQKENEIKGDSIPSVTKSLRRESSDALEEDATSIHNNREAGVNKDLCSLAQAFFDTDKGKRPPPQRRISASSRLNTQKDAPSSSSTLSDWSSESTQDRYDRRSYPLPPERVYFQPSNSAEVDDDDDNLSMPTIINRPTKDSSKTNQSLSTNNSKRPEVNLKTPSQIYKERSPSTQEDAPPIPERSAQPKMMMLKLMKNATNALKNN